MTAYIMRLRYRLNLAKRRRDIIGVMGLEAQIAWAEAR